MLQTGNKIDVYQIATNARRFLHKHLKMFNSNVENINNLLQTWNFTTTWSLQDICNYKVKKKWINVRSNWMDE